MVAWVLIANRSLFAAEIHDLAWAGDFERVKALIEADPKLIEAEDDLRQIPLHLAARGGHPEMVRFLLSRGSPVNRTAYNNFTPLRLTSSGAVARILIKAGADIHARDVYTTVMQDAARDRKLQVIEALLEAGEIIDFQSAIDLGMTEKAKELLTANPALAKGGQWSDPLSRATNAGQQQIVELLLDLGADVNTGIDDLNVRGAWTALSTAVVSHDLEIAKLLLERGANPNVSGGRNFESLLHFAVAECPSSFVRLLLEKGADPNRASEWGEGTVLHQAAVRGDLEMVDLLLSFGADVNGGRGAVPPLLLAAGQGHQEVAGVLLAHGASLDISIAAALGNSAEVMRFLDADPALLEKRDGYVGRTPLAWAVSRDHSQLAAALLERGAQVDARASSSWWPANEYYGRLQRDAKPPTQYGETPLHLAAESGDVNLVRLLLDHGADVNARAHSFENQPGGSALHMAAAAGNLDVARLLLDRGANVNLQSSGAMTPLHSSMKHPTMVKLLIDRGADINAITKEGCSALDLTWESNPESINTLIAHGAKMNLFTAIRLGLPDVVKSMIEREPELANATQAGHPDQSILQAAAANAEVDLVTFLLDHGAAVNYVDKSHRTALWEASEKGDLEIVSLLLSRGAVVTRDYYFGSPLFAAAKSGDVEVGRLLIQNGADIHQRSLGLETPLHIAASSNRVDFINFLLDAGIDVNIDGEGDGGMMPLHAAAAAGAEEAVRVLLDRGADIHARDYRGQTALDWARDERTLGFCELEEKAKKLEALHATAKLLEERDRR